MATLLKFLMKHKVEQGSLWTHTTLNNPKGSFYIDTDDEEEFLKTYTEALCNGMDLHITEKHRDISPILIDLDFRHKENTRVYTEDTIVAFIKALYTNIETYIKTQEDIKFYVMEKPKPREGKGNGFKDGIHIVCPDIVTKPDVQYLIRKKMLENHMFDVFQQCSFMNTYEDIYDEAVIERNNWFIYGSKKPDEEYAWAVTKVYNGEGKMIENDKTTEELVKLLSIRNKFECSNVKEDRVQELLTFKTYEKTQNKKQKETRQMSFTQEKINKIVSLLNSSRADNYNTWIRVGWALHNIDEDLLDTWIQFSKQSQKFTEGECENLWSSMRDEGLHIGTLCMWAKEDNPTGYKELVNSELYNDIKECNGTHNSVAAVAYKILKNKFVCATANGKLWYEFNGALWKEDKEGIHLRHELSTTVVEQFIYSYYVVQRDLPIEDLQSGGTMTSKRRQTSEAAQKFLQISMKLQDAHFKDNVVREMREYFYDGDFLKKLDSNIHLLGFKNGVWDFTLNKFRYAKPDDYMSLNVGFDYIHKPDVMKQQKVADYYNKLHPNPEQRDYVIKTLARQLYGDSGNELFHIHAGSKNSAGNGKTKFFETLETVLGDYVRKFPVQVLTAKVREEAGKPAPEYGYWRGRRILYCTEPKGDDILHSGIMKDLTGGEKILYRQLFSNDVHDFRPQFKMHIMCNDPPKVDGADEGVKRRIRKVDYISRFVDDEDINESEHKYRRDGSYFEKLKEDDGLKMESLRLFLDYFRKEYEFQMPEVVKKNSMVYLDENDGLRKFVKECIEEDKEGAFTLLEAKMLFKQKEYFDHVIEKKMKQGIEKVLDCKCHAQKRIDGVKKKNVFTGYSLIHDSIDILE